MVVDLVLMVSNFDNLLFELFEVVVVYIDIVMVVDKFNYKS